jgi:parvulin-like peptidyl-prolyl isomerase
MKACCRAYRLLEVFAILVSLGVTGCQAAAPRPAAAGLEPDFLSLASMAGSSTPTVLTRAQKSESGRGPAGLLELGPDTAGNQENRSARIRAVVNGDAILDEEVVAAAYQQLVGARTEKDKAEILNKKLNELIDREVVLQDAVNRLGHKNGGALIRELNRYASKEFERQWLHRMMRANKFEDEKAFKRFLQDNGMPLHMIRRQWERNFLAMEYMRSRLEPQLNRIGHVQVLEYYQAHADEFKVEDHVVWQDIFIAAARHASREAAHGFAEGLLARVRKGEDFAALAKEHDNGDSSLRDNAEGIGHKRGEIAPAEAEPVLWGLKKGECAVVEVGGGYHIVKLRERQYAGRRQFEDQKVQKEIRDKLRGEIFEVEMKRIVNSLKRKAVIEIAHDVTK